jgi:hypothetical protein
LESRSIRVPPIKVKYIRIPNKETVMAYKSTITAAFMKVNGFLTNAVVKATNSI